MARKVEYPALLSGGFHTLTIEQIREMCEYPFPLSKTRKRIMDNLAIAVDRIDSAKFQAELWIDGSFLTQKIDPSDVDVALIVPAHVRTTVAGLVLDTLNWIESDETSDQLLIDGYVITHHPDSSTMVGLWYAARDQFTKLFGTEYDDKTPKGVAVIRFRGGVI